MISRPIELGSLPLNHGNLRSVLLASESDLAPFPYRSSSTYVETDDNDAADDVVEVDESGVPCGGPAGKVGKGVGLLALRSAERALRVV